MKIKTRMESFASLEGIAITDIIMNMFIFFFTSFSLVYTFNPTKESTVPIKLPQAGIHDTKDQKEPIVVMIDERNVFYLNDRPLTSQELEGSLKSLINRNPQKSVIVRADKRVVIDVAVQVLDMAWSAGAGKVSIAILEKPSAEKRKD